MFGKKALPAVMAALVATMFMAGCSSMESESVADHMVGPVGPTYPSGYYFEGSVTPHSVVPPTSVVFMIRVYDQNGNLVAGVPVSASGAEDTAISTTGSDGVALFSLQVKTRGSGNIMGSVSYFTFIIEDTVLTIPLQLIPSVA